MFLICMKWLVSFFCIIKIDNFFCCSQILVILSRDLMFTINALDLQVASYMLYGTIRIVHTLKCLHLILENNYNQGPAIVLE